MARDDFLRELRTALQGRIAQGKVNEQLQYYENYIIEESRKGRTEDQILKELGNPRLIAKTIINTSGDNDHYEECNAGRQAEHKKKTRFEFHHRGILSVGLLVLFLLCFLKIGILLLPILSAVILVGGICYLLFRVFF